jgi:hypothetical protein
MSDQRSVVRVMMNALIEGTFGCYDAAAETINARWGRGASKGTISKKTSGVLDFSIADMIALEDAAGHHPITKWLARRLKPRPSVGADVCLSRQSGLIAKESGEAIAAILSADQSSNADERAQAIQEIIEAEAALKTARLRLEEEQ